MPPNVIEWAPALQASLTTGTRGDYTHVVKDLDVLIDGSLSTSTRGFA